MIMNEREREREREREKKKKRKKILHDASKKVANSVLRFNRYGKKWKRWNVGKLERYFSITLFFFRR